MLRYVRCVQNFVIKWHMRSSSQKNKIAHFFKKKILAKFCFFVTSSYNAQTLWNLHARCTPKPLWCQKIFILFWIFLLFFWIYCLLTYIFIVFCLSWATRMLKHHEILHGSCAPEYLRCCKISDFFHFDAFFYFTVHRVTIHHVLKTARSGTREENYPVLIVEGRKLPGFDSWGTKTIRFRVEGRFLNSRKSSRTKNILIPNLYVLSCWLNFPWISCKRWLHEKDIVWFHLFR